jgi:signal transduction histidine kinase
MVNLDCIALPSMGSLVIAAVAILLHYYLSRLYALNNRLVWNLWGSLLSLCAVAYSLAAFLLYNTDQAALLRTAGRIQGTTFVLAAHFLFGYTFAYLGIRMRKLHYAAAALDVLLVGVIWSTDLFVTGEVARLNYLLLPDSYQEAVYGPLGNALIAYLGLLAVVLIAFWIRNKRAKKLPGSLIAALFVWLLLGLQDSLSLLLPAVGALMPLTEYGFLGFSLAVLSNAIRDSQLLFQLAESRGRSLEQAKVAAESANRAKSAFLAKISHELRTPLNHIIGFTELVADQQLGQLNETQREYLGDSLDSSRHLLSLLNDILDLSKIEAGKAKLHLAPLSLQPLLKDSVKVIAEKAAAIGIETVILAEDLPPTVIADERRLRQILFNLLSNAVKFTPRGGRITLSARFQTDAVGQPRIRVSVSDTGIGIQKADLERIFLPFEQADPLSPHAGTGLGLSLCRELVQMHNGRIWAESEGLGRGATFRFEFPLAPGGPAGNCT